ncbi:hypothetical protein GUITHDRAFT_111948 [Guillardia theta CCMP2712]|uniref:RWP-RK domain-containing protein n=1 Tax=Guillardia theta (strain CCMP2712) TaxID=905079 RepID=L1J0Q8_GUITC|nr:hypothetical protein GUITHDRAFT_111948 [Guillardia theta CCMP2712]EKX42096.1 hypothetical protein GUITHDRAFT_111948 [Guillardia theta CCMP2712]|eukprot:XP_005829076.1 hypothetical protein GUITHDRAFT_111948 [Guillardia theta CCMP2712]
MLGPKVARVFLRKRRDETGEGQQPSQREVLITNETIESLLHLRQTDAANQLGISLTALKNACKYLGFDNWPTARSNLVATQPTASVALPSVTSPAPAQTRNPRNRLVAEGEAGRSGLVGSRKAGRGEKRQRLAESIPALKSHGLEELMLDALEHVADL